MPTIRYLPEEREARVSPLETILEASLRLGIPHAHACGGNARCSTCRVVVTAGLEYCSPPTEAELLLAGRLRLAPEIRLACQTRVAGGMVRLRRMVLDEEDLQLARARQEPGALGEERPVAILFADIRGFTAFAESLPAYDVIHILNRYFHHVGRVIALHGGSVDNTMGDGLLALFGLEEEAGAARGAVRAGLGMLAAVEHLRPYLEGVYERAFGIGIGIHHGEVVLGAVGAAAGRRVTAIGDAVNLASRIEQATRETGAQLLVSETVYSQVRSEFRAGRRFNLPLRGKTGEYALYEVLGESGH